MFYFQGASATHPSYLCDVKLSDLKTHGKAIQEHNFNTQKCKVRDFDHMKTNLAGQIRRLGEDDISVDTFSEESDTDAAYMINKLHLASTTPHLRAELGSIRLQGQ